MRAFAQRRVDRTHPDQSASENALSAQHPRVFLYEAGSPAELRQGSVRAAFTQQEVSKPACGQGKKCLTVEMITRFQGGGGSSGHFTCPKWVPATLFYSRQDHLRSKEISETGPTALDLETVQEQPFRMVIFSAYQSDLTETQPSRSPSGVCRGCIQEMLHRGLVEGRVLFGCSQIGCREEIMGQNQVRLPLHSLMPGTNRLFAFSLSHAGIAQPRVSFARAVVQLDRPLQISCCAVAISSIGSGALTN